MVGGSFLVRVSEMVHLSAMVNLCGTHCSYFDLDDGTGETCVIPLQLSFG
jgi:hypothetical protein